MYIDGCRSGACPEAEAPRRASPVASRSSIRTSSASRPSAWRPVAKALGDPIRMQLVDVLRKHAGKVCVCELVPLFDLSQPTVSHHLKVLREAGIVGSERRGPLGLLLRQPRRAGGAERMAEQTDRTRTRSARRCASATPPRRARSERADAGCCGGRPSSARAAAASTSPDACGRRRRSAPRSTRPRTRERAARRREARLARLRQPDRRRRAARGRDRARPRLGRRHRRAALGAAGRARPARPTDVDMTDEMLELARAQPAPRPASRTSSSSRGRSRRSRCPTTRSTWSSPTA